MREAVKMVFSSTGLELTRQFEGSVNESELQSSVDCVNGAVTATISQNKFDALVDFCYSVGRVTFLSSNLLHRTNLLDFFGAASEFMKYVGPDLVARRMAERDLFLGK